MLNTQIIITRIDDLAHMRGLSRNVFLQQCGAKNYVDNLLKGRKPEMDATYQIAEYYNISIDYLTGLSNNPSPSPDLLDAFLALSPERRNVFIQEAVKYI